MARDNRLGLRVSKAMRLLLSFSACDIGRRARQKQLACFRHIGALVGCNNNTDSGIAMTDAFTPVISATGLYTPTDTVSNEELVASFNAYVDLYNAQNPDAEPLVHSSVEFVEKRAASNPAM